MLLNLPTVGIDAEGRVNAAHFEQYTRELLEHSREVKEVIEYRTPRPALFTSTKSIATGLVSTGIDNLAEAIGNPHFKYDVNALGVTIFTPGVYQVGISGSFAANAAGQTRQHLVSSSKIGTFLFPTAAVLPAGATTGDGATTYHGVEPYETLTVLARQDSGGNLNVVTRFSLTYYGPLPLS